MFLALALQTPSLPPTLVVDGFVVGAKTRGKWSPVLYQKGGWGRRSTATFRIVGLGTLGGTVRAGFREEEVPQGVYLGKGSNTIPDEVLVAGMSPRVLRPVVSLPKGSSVYRAALRRFLDANQLRGATPRIVRIVQCDLDGDGTKEILIEARTREELDDKGLTVRLSPNDYAVILLRAIRGGKVVEIPLMFAGAQGTKDSPLTGRLRAVADLDGDGRMEVVASYSAWESFGGMMWSYRAGRAVRVLQNGSGV